MKSKYILFTFILLILSFNPLLAVEIKATVDRNPVSINESFQLTYTATESPDDDPEFSPLEKNFEILNQSKSSSSSWFNGKSSKSIQWKLNLMAKTTGNVKIPAITFGDDSSLQLTLLVKQQQINNHTATKDLFLEVEATPKTAYVQSQVLYTVRLYRRVQISQASLNEPEVTDAIIENLGEDKNFNTKVNGVAYAVTERKYAIFPQKSGLTTIKPLTLTANVISNNQSRYNSFFNRQSTTTKRVSSKAIALDIKPAPTSFTGKYWIPSEQVYIEQKWSGDINHMKVGEPLTRTLTLLAKSTTVAQLPELHNITSNSQLKTYPDQANLKEQKKADGIIAFREEKIAYIPSQSGSQTLAAIEIPWFNTKTQTMEVASIPEQTLVALSGSNATTNQPLDNISNPIVKEAIKSEAIIQTVANPFWMWLSMFLAFAWLITLWFLLTNRQTKSDLAEVNPQEIKLKDTIKTLKKACANNNQLDAKNALLNWGKLKFNSASLMAIAPHCEARLRDEIKLLNQNLYALEAEEWTGKKLFQAFTENNAREKVAKKIDDKLEPLYKV